MVGGNRKGATKRRKAFFCAFLCKKGAGIFAFAPFDRTTPKMNDEHAGSSVDAVVAALKSPLQNKLLGYFLSNGWARHNYSISFK